MMDTFTGWIEGFSTWFEKAEEVVKKTAPLNLSEIWSAQVLQSNNGTPFTFTFTRGTSKTLGITSSLPCA